MNEVKGAGLIKGLRRKWLFVAIVSNIILAVSISFLLTVLVHLLTNSTYAWFPVFFVLAPDAESQSADSLKDVRRIYVGSLGTYSRGEDLRRDLVRYLKKSSQFHL